MKLTDQELQKLIDLCNNGYSNEYIAKQFNVGKSTISRFIKEKNISKKKENTYKKYPIEDIKHDYLHTDLKMQDICKKYHIHYNNLLKILGDLYKSVNKRKTSSPKNNSITKEFLQDCLNKNMTYKQMSSITGMSETCLRKWIKQFHINKSTNEQFPQKDGYKKLNKETLIDCFINKNMKYEDLPSIFGYSKSTITRLIKKLNIQKPKELKIKLRQQTCNKKYGVSYISQNNKIKEKVKQTNLKKYGSTCTLQSQVIKEKALKTLKQKYNNQNIINASQINIPPETLSIIHDREKLKQYIIQNDISSASELASKLNLNESGCMRIIHNFNLDYLKSYSQSAPEKYIREYIQKHFTVESNTRKYIDGYEIDIYIPEKKIGIEFNGNWWHSEYKIKKNYHIQKSNLAKEKGIFLYHIFEYEWKDKQEQIINQLNNLLGLNTQKIYARNCIIKEVPSSEKNLFLSLNHLQGQDKSHIKLGLYHNNDLVSIMTFTKARFNKHYEWELSRFCSKANTTVVGGASKLFKHFIRTYKPKSIISYSNIAHTKGTIYKTLGFTFVHDTSPNYVWCNNKHVLSRYQCQKHLLLKKGLTGNTETEIMHNQKYFKIYDCGNKQWVWVQDK